MDVLSPREVPLGGLRAMTVRRTLPQRGRTLIGAWCFVDHYGPDDVGGDADDPRGRHGRPAAPAHGSADRELAVLRRDRAPRLRGPPRHGPPGEVNLMTAGRGISHSEYSTPDHDHPPRRPAVARPARRGPPGRPRLRAPRPRAGPGRRLGGPRVPGLAARLDLARPDLLTAAGGRAGAASRRSRAGAGRPRLRAGGARRPGRCASTGRRWRRTSSASALPAGTSWCSRRPGRRRREARGPVRLLLLGGPPSASAS